MCESYQIQADIIVLLRLKRVNLGMNLVFKQLHVNLLSAKALSASDIICVPRAKGVRFRIRSICIPDKSMDPCFPLSRKNVTFYLSRISTGNPRYKVSREQAFRHAKNAVNPSCPVARVLARIYNNSRINSRYFCVPDLTVAPTAPSTTNTSPSIDDIMDGYGDLIESSWGNNGAGREVQESLEMFYPSDGR